MNGHPSAGLVLYVCQLPYSRKYWRSLNLAVWSQAAKIKILADLNLAVVLCSVIRHYKHCECVYQGALPSSSLRYLNKAVSSQIHKKYDWQHVKDELELYVQLAKRGAGRDQERYSMHVLCLTHCGCGQHNIGGF